MGPCLGKPARKTQTPGPQSQDSPRSQPFPATPSSTSQQQRPQVGSSTFQRLSSSSRAANAEHPFGSRDSPGAGPSSGIAPPPPPRSIGPIRFDHPEGCCCRECKPTWNKDRRILNTCVPGCRCEMCMMRREYEAKYGKFQSLSRV